MTSNRNSAKESGKGSPSNALGIITPISSAQHLLNIAPIINYNLVNNNPVSIKMGSKLNFPLNGLTPSPFYSLGISKPMMVKEKGPDSHTRWFLRSWAQVTGVGIGVAAGLLPLDFAMHLLHTKSPAVAGEAKVNTTKQIQHKLEHLGKGFRNIKLEPMARTFALSASQSTIKNFFLGLRKTKLNALEENRELDAEVNNNSKSAKPSLANVGLTSLLIGGADTTVCSYLSNYRTLNFQQMTPGSHANYQLPVIKDNQRFFKFCLAGYNLRLASNVLKTSGMIISEVSIDPLKQCFQPILGKGADEAAKDVAAIASGSFTGFVCNALDIVYKSQVRQINPETLKTPSILKVIESLKNEQVLSKQATYKAFTRGFGTSILYTVFAYRLVPFIENTMQGKAIPKLENAVDCTVGTVHCFFNTTGTLARKASDLVKKTKEKVDEINKEQGFRK